MRLPFIIEHVFLPNFLLLGGLTWAAELVVALCLLFGVFSRFSGLLSTDPLGALVRLMK